MSFLFGLALILASLEQKIGASGLNVFSISEPQNTSIGFSKHPQISRLADFVALKLGNVRSGRCKSEINLTTYLYLFPTAVAGQL